MRPIALAILVAVVVAACSSTPAPSAPATSPSAAPTPSSQPLPTPTPRPTTAPSPSDEPSPSNPGIGTAPDGAWSALRWLDGGAFPLRDHQITVRGWSGGFIAFEQSPGSNDNGETLPVTIRAAASPDGLHWSQPTRLETGFKGNLAISTIAEGPSGLLALGYPYGDTCGGPPIVEAMWASKDGRTWERLAMPKPFTSGAVQKIAGGPAGFIAFGSKSDGVTQGIWTSQDGRSWTSRTLPPVSSGTLAIDDVASFDDGFVLVGSVLGEEGCGGAEHIRSAVWFSTDGATWTRTALPGASTDPRADFHLSRLLGRLIVTQVEPTTDSAMDAWGSTDGRSWSSIADVPSDLLWSAVSDGNHVVMVIGPNADTNTGAPTIVGFDEGAFAVTLEQEGPGPVETEDGPGWTYAVGPTGLLAVRSDGGASWVGAAS